MGLPMGHEILVYRDRRAIINDIEFATVRHFLVAGGEATGFADVATFAEGWKYEGPGVWTGEDLDAFLHGDQPLERRFRAALDGAFASALAFGEHISPDHLMVALAPLGVASSGSGLPTRLVLDAIEAIRDLFSERAPPSAAT